VAHPHGRQTRRRRVLAPQPSQPPTKGPEKQPWEEATQQPTSSALVAARPRAPGGPRAGSEDLHRLLTDELKTTEDYTARMTAACDRRLHEIREQVVAMQQRFQEEVQRHAGAYQQTMEEVERGRAMLKAFVGERMRKVQEHILQVQLRALDTTVRSTDPRLLRDLQEGELRLRLPPELDLLVGPG